MKFLDLINLVIKDLKYKKLTSFLTLFAISLGILSLFVIFILSSSFQKSIDSQFEKLGSNRLYITTVDNSFTSTSFTKGLTDKEVNLVSNKPYVIDVFPYYMKSDQIKFGNDYFSTRILGSNINDYFFESYDMDLIKGRFPKSNEKYSLVIGNKVYDGLLDKKVELGSNLYINDKKFKVVGILKSVGNPDDDSVIYANINTLRDIYGAKDSVGFMDILIDKNYDMDLASENLKVFLENKIGKDLIKVVSPKQLIEQVGLILNIINGVFGVIAFVSLIVGALGIINTMFVIVTEKIKEIAIMKSVGGRNIDILLIFISYSSFFGFLGAILGIILGTGFVFMFEYFAHVSGFSLFNLYYDYNYILYFLLFGIFIGFISGYFPARRASKLVIVEAIRK
jgi:putative ABC transport system permease protein